MTGGPLLWHPSSASVLRNSSETTSALCCLPHWIRCNLHIAATVPQTMLLHSPCTLLSLTWKTRAPMWGCCLWTTATFNTIVPDTLVAKLQTLGLNRSLCSWILDFLTGRSQVVSGQQHFISADPQHWCFAGLRSQPTPVLPVHTWLYSHTQLQRHRQIRWRHNGDRPDHWQRWDGLQSGGEYPD